MFNYLKNLFSLKMSDQENYIYARIGKIALWGFPILVIIFSTVYSFNPHQILRLFVLFCGGAFIVLFVLSLFFAIRYKHNK